MTSASISAASRLPSPISLLSSEASASRPSVKAPSRERRSSRNTLQGGEESNKWGEERLGIGRGGECGGGGGACGVHSGRKKCSGSSSGMRDERGWEGGRRSEISCRKYHIRLFEGRSLGRQQYKLWVSSPRSGGPPVQPSAPHGQAATPRQRQAVALNAGMRRMLRGVQQQLYGQSAISCRKMSCTAVRRPLFRKATE